MRSYYRANSRIIARLRQLVGFDPNLPLLAAALLKSMGGTTAFHHFRPFAPAIADAKSCRSATAPIADILFVGSHRKFSATFLAGGRKLGEYRSARTQTFQHQTSTQLAVF